MQYCWIWPQWLFRLVTGLTLLQLFLSVFFHSYLSSVSPACRPVLWQCRPAAAVALSLLVVARWRPAEAPSAPSVSVTFTVSLSMSAMTGQGSRSTPIYATCCNLRHCPETAPCILLIPLPRANPNAPTTPRSPWPPSPPDPRSPPCRHPALPWTHPTTPPLRTALSPRWQRSTWSKRVVVC